MALVLSRRVKESIYIGDDIKVTVVSVRKSVAGLAIEAPDGVKIVREELIPKEEESNVKD